VKDVGAKVD